MENPMDNREALSNIMLENEPPKLEGMQETIGEELPPQSRVDLNDGSGIKLLESPFADVAQLKRKRNTVSATMGSNIKRLCPWHSIRCILMMTSVGYYLIGAKIFQALETDINEELKTSIWEAKAALMKSYTNITPEELEIFLQKLTYSVQHGIIPLGNGSHVCWDFKNSFLFVMSTLTTIGFGPISPRTPTGQLFCIFYALLGIPQTIIFLNFVSTVMSWPFSGLGKYLHNMGLEERQIKICIFLFFFITGLLIFILLPPLIFMHTEGWTYNEGVYFAFITLSTIGFGDYELGINPSRNYSSIYPLVIILWCIFGLTWSAPLFFLFTKVLEK